jgi:biotin carboxylase
MPNVAFAAPFLFGNTLRFLEGMVALDGVRIGLLTGDPLEKVPAGIRQGIDHYQRLENPLDAQQILDGCRALASEMGSLDRLIGVLEQVQGPLGEVRDALGLPGLGAEAANNFRDKAKMKDILRRAEIPCARHALALDEAAVWKGAEKVGFPMVVKPPAGAGAKGTFRLDDADQLREALAMGGPASSRPWMMEEFVVGDEQSFDTICIRGTPVWHSLTHYLPTPLEAIRNPWIQWCVVLPREVEHPRYDDIRSAAFRSLDALGMGTGFAHMEWFRRKDGSVAVSEVAARPPGAQIGPLIMYAHGFDFYREWCRLMVYEQWEAPPRQFSTGAAFLRGQGPGRVKRVHGLDRVQQEMGDLIVEANLPRPGQPKSSSYEGEGNIVLRHPKTAVIMEALHRLVSTVRVEME